PMDVRLKLVNFLARKQTEFAVVRLNFTCSSLDFYGVALMRPAIVRGDGKAFPLQHYTTYASKLFVKLLFRSVDNGHNFSGHLFTKQRRREDEWVLRKLPRNRIGVSMHFARSALGVR